MQDAHPVHPSPWYAAPMSIVKSTPEVPGSRYTVEISFRTLFDPISYTVEGPNSVQVNDGWVSVIEEGEQFCYPTDLILQVHISPEKETDFFPSKEDG